MIHIKFDVKLNFATILSIASFVLGIIQLWR